jgi:hypothetical protein
MNTAPLMTTHFMCGSGRMLFGVSICQVNWYCWECWENPTRLFSFVNSSLSTEIYMSG